MQLKDVRCSLCVNLELRTVDTGLGSRVGSVLAGGLFMGTLDELSAALTAKLAAAWLEFAAANVPSEEFTSCIDSLAPADASTSRS